MYTIYMETIRYIPNDLDRKERKVVKNYLGNERKEAAKVVEGEVEKDETEIALVNLVNDCLKEEFEGLDMVPLDKIKPSQIHMMSDEGFDNFFQKHGIQNATDAAVGRAVVIDKSAYVNKEALKGYLEELSVILHESIHLLGYDKYSIDRKEASITTYRIGYVVRNLKSDDAPALMIGLNEAVVEKLTLEILEKNKIKIVERLNIQSQEDWESGIGKSYSTEIAMLDLLTAKISVTNGEPQESVWSRFKKGHFTGEMMHLRDIDRAYGRGSMRVLSHMTWPDPNKELILKVLKYFLSRDENEKLEIISELLGEEQAKKYKRVRK